MISKNDIFFILKLQNGISACIAIPHGLNTLHMEIINHLLDSKATLNKSCIEGFESYIDRPNRYTAILDNWNDYEVLIRSWTKKDSLAPVN